MDRRRRERVCSAKPARAKVISFAERWTAVVEEVDGSRCMDYEVGGCVMRGLSCACMSVCLMPVCIAATLMMCTDGCTVLGTRWARVRLIGMRGCIVCFGAG